VEDKKKEEVELDFIPNFDPAVARRVYLILSPRAENLHGNRHVVVTQNQHLLIERS
jgi:hypothetical protein